MSSGTRAPAPAVGCPPAPAAAAAAATIFAAASAASEAAGPTRSGDAFDAPTSFCVADANALAATADEPACFLRGHPVLLEVIRRTMNPVDAALAPGNWGRYNFSGRGPDGSFMDVRVGPVGSIISLPGSADQALHADTPHLMELFDCLPAHYINVFTPGCAADPAVGQTALVHGSHRLSFTAALEDGSHCHSDGNHHSRSQNNTANPKLKWIQSLVRPLLDVGDVLLFDCRILHFGLANTSPTVQRPLLYTNVTQHWFHDPKNWDNQRPIFNDDGDDGSTNIINDEE